ncbi:MAG TPA: hypothetical protein VGS16_07145 [Candidatus Dormibacteraeota bacterium]|nr:hypothetical protein [Candidatus Dormibacteraeota bacterium]
MSLPGPRLAATFGALWLVTFALSGVLADALAPSTWVALKPLPHQGHSAIFGLAVDPANSQLLIAGNSEGSLLRSTNAGSTWTAVLSGKSVSTTIAFSPFQGGVVLAGTRGSGAVLSRDDGATWLPVSGLDGRVVHAFSFALTLVAAATDKGVFISQDGSTWSQSGLANRSIDALVVTAVHTPIRMLAGSDGPLSAGNLPMFQTADGGVTWSALNPAISGTYVVKLAAGPLPPVGDTRPMVAGTNAGLFASTDNGVSFLPLSGASQLPSTDYTQVAFITDHFDRLYAASDGGGSGAGGLWRTNDGGQTFISLAPPMRSITALAVSNDESPTLYVATFRPSDHVAALWVYRDTGGTPQGPLGSSTPVASGSRGGSGSSGGSGLLSILTSSQAPYIALGLGALLIVLLAGVAHLRGRRR